MSIFDLRTAALAADLDRKVNGVNAMLPPEDQLTVDELRLWCGQDPDRTLWTADLMHDFVAVGLSKIDAIMASRAAMSRYGPPLSR